MIVKNISLIRKDLFNIVDIVIEYNEQITIITKKGNAIMISEEEYNSMNETIYLSSQKGLLEKITEGEKEDISNMKTYNPNEKW